MHILVTGACGYKGTVLVPKLLKAGHDVVALDVMWFGNFLEPHPKLTVTRGDVRNTEEIPLEGVEAIIHLSSVANDPCGDLDPKLTWEISCLATMQLADRAVRRGIKRFIYASSGSVYGVKEEQDVTEDLELTPISEYNKTKMVAERVVLSYGDRLAATIIRPATVCGFSPRMRLDLTVNLLTMQALTTRVMTVFGGSQTRPNIHIDDLVDLYLFALEKRLRGIYNAGFENLSVLNIAERIAARTGAEIRVSPSDDPRSYAVCSDRLLATGFAPTRSVEVAITDLVAAYRDGRLTDEPAWRNVSWMKRHEFA